MRQQRLIALFISLFSFCLLGGVQPLAQTADDQYAATLEIARRGVEVRRVETRQWIALPQGAQIPVGAGDQLRTRRSGRALLSFVDGSQLLVLPSSALTIETYRPVSDEAWQLQARLDGVGVMRNVAITDLALATFNFTVSDAIAHFAIWADPSQADVITVAEGAITVSTRDARAYALNAGEAFRYAPDEPLLLTLDAPFNRARVLVATDSTCAGSIQTRDDAGVYLGAGTGYEQRGFIDEAGTYPLFARTRSGFWTRIQFGNGFGWIVTELVDVRCFLPIVPDDTGERTREQVIAPSTQELDLLRPFFGDLSDDPWFYGQ